MSAVSIGQMAVGLVGQIGRGERIGSKVHACSYDEDSPQADIFRPICGGDKDEFDIWRAQVMKAAYDFDDDRKEPGQQSGPLGDNGLRVLRAMLYEFLDYRDGRCFPALITIAEKVKRSKVTVIAALDRLAEHGFLTWVRRTRKTGHKRGEGPQREQISNAYKIVNQARMDREVLKSIRSRIVNRRKHQAAKAKLNASVAAKNETCRQKAAERAELSRATKPHGSSDQGPTAIGSLLHRIQSLLPREEAKNDGSSIGLSASSGPELYPM